MAAGPLDGVRVVEITMFQQGPVAGMRLGDLGADVIKTEAKTGDPARGLRIEARMPKSWSRFWIRGLPLKPEMSGLRFSRRRVVSLH